mgnify:CR=1 FL=1
MRYWVVLGAAAMLGACGQKSMLEPVEGASLPPAPYGAEAQPDADDLLALDPTATLAARARVANDLAGALADIAGTVDAKKSLLKYLLKKMKN